MAHIVACIWIIIGRIPEDFNDSWFVKVPAPQTNFPNNYREEFNESEYSIYVHALYWSYVTTSHVGVGDVNAVNFTERFYSIIIMLISNFTTIYFFGNLASLVDQLAPILKIRYDSCYKTVITSI